MAPLVTMLVFSKDRPLQLDAALRSWTRHCQAPAIVAVKVLYKASTSRMSSLYRRLMQEHPDADFVPEGKFRRDCLMLVGGAENVLFVVDDTVFVRDFKITDMVRTLRRQPEVLGVSMRLGRNTTYCYSSNHAQDLPEFTKLGDGLLKYKWPGASYDFGYPLEVSSSVYRSREMLALLESVEFKNPNTLEEVMFQNLARFQESHPFLVCPEQSWAFSIPANKVQQICDNRAGANDAYSAEALAALFASGQRIRTEAFDNFVPKGCHEEVELQTAPAGRPTPLVSVVIPCYKQAEYLAEAVDSVAAQNFDDWEIIIVNDGSPDNTSDVAHSLMERHTGKRIRLLEKRNGGLASARNAGIRAAAGACILPLDADDKLDPTMLSKTVALLESDPGIAIAYTDIAHFGVTEKVVQAAEFDFTKLCGGNQLNYCSLFRREAWEQVGGYRSLLYGYEDWDFWISCGERGFVAKRIPEPLLQYRVKDSSMFTDAVANDAALRARIVLNHLALYDTKAAANAAALWAKPPLPPQPNLPKVSVIVPTHNRPSRLLETLRSIAAQTLQDVEIIVVNDNGIDVDHVIARCETGMDIIYLRHSTNRGLAAARNTGLRHARGKFIAFVDDDDIFLPDHLQTLVEFLESSGNQAAYTDAWCAKEEPDDNGGYKVVQRDVQFSADWDNDSILVRNLAPVLCFVHERTAGIAAGEFDETLTTHEDWDYWLRLSRVCAPVHLKKVTGEFRLRQDGSSMTSSRRADFLRTARIIYKKHQALAAGKRDIRKQQQKFLHGLEREMGVLDTGFAAMLRRLFD